MLRRRESGVIGTLCVYAGSNLGDDPAYRIAAEQLAEAMAQSGRRLVYGGSAIGLMGTVADRMLMLGAVAIGVMPKGLILGEMVHPGLTKLIEVNGMHARKETMNKLADGFIALPGGIGTFDELFEILCWAQIGLHHKPIGLLNAGGYFEPLLALIRHCVRHEFAHSSNLKLLVVSNNPNDLLKQMDRWTPPVLGHKWRQIPNHRP
jgi:uncharacterized protein (TIGR00730 family)